MQKNVKKVPQDDIDEISNRSILKEQIIKRLIENKGTSEKWTLLRKIMT